jgi:anti-anti-sigma factor
MFEREERDGGIVLRIKGSMSVIDIASIKKEILGCFEKCNDLTLDLKGIDVCDISGLQLLCSARKTAKSGNKSFSVDGESDAIIDTFNRAGMDPETVIARKLKIQNPKNGKEVSNGQGHHDG